MFNFFTNKRKLKDAEEVLARDKRLLAQYEDKRALTEKNRWVFLLYLVVGGLALLYLWNYFDPPKPHHERPNFVKPVPPVRDTTYRLEQ